MNNDTHTPVDIVIQQHSTGKSWYNRYHGASLSRVVFFEPLEAHAIVDTTTPARSAE